MPVDQQWLDQVKEEIIEPDRRICDPHHHLWDRGGSRYLLDELLAERPQRGEHRLRGVPFHVP